MLLGLMAWESNLSPNAPKPDGEMISNMKFDTKNINPL